MGRQLGWVGEVALKALKNGRDNKSPTINSALKNIAQFEVAFLVIVAVFTCYHC